MADGVFRNTLVDVSLQATFSHVAILMNDIECEQTLISLPWHSLSDYHYPDRTFHVKCLFRLCSLAPSFCYDDFPKKRRYNQADKTGRNATTHRKSRSNSVAVKGKSDQEREREQD